MVDQTVGIARRDDFHEVAAAHSQVEIDVLLELAGRRQGEMALEDDTIKAVQRARDRVCELGEKGPHCIHGILPRLVGSGTD
jgi:hypothetical protein